MFHLSIYQNTNTFANDYLEQEIEGKTPKIAMISLKDAVSNAYCLMILISSNYKQFTKELQINFPGNTLKYILPKSMIVCVSLTEENSCKEHYFLDSQIKLKLPSPAPPPQILELMHSAVFRKKNYLLKKYFVCMHCVFCKHHKSKSK